MGLTKQYLRYGPHSLFNLVGSTRAGIVCLDLPGGRNKLCAVGACENVIIWDLRKGEKALILQGTKQEVTALAKSPIRPHLAVGYSDGTIKVWNLSTAECDVTFSGHRSAISALNYDHQGMRLVSGAKDTDVIVWDIVNEAGLYRLKGHKGIITQARFLKQQNILITSAKDTFVKFWDLDTHHCFRTLVGHRTEVWDFVVVHNDKWLITGSADMDIRVWSISYKVQGEAQASEAKKPKLESVEDDLDQEDEDEEESGILQCERLGSLLRQGRDRVVTMQTDPSGTMLVCHGTDSTLEVFKILTEEEVETKLHKKQKKARKRARESGDEADKLVAMELKEQIIRVANIKMSAKLRSVDCSVEKTVAKMTCLLTNNTVETCECDLATRPGAATNMTSLSHPGHRSDVRTTCFSSDSTALMSASADCLKIWNRATLQCIRTLKCDYALCSLFAPGDRHVIIGTKSGGLQIFDLAAAGLMETVAAHTGAVWSICMAPDKRSVVSGSADHEVKFWDFELVTDEAYSTTSKRLSLVHTRTLKMSEDVLCVKFSPDARLLAVSLLDSTVKVFFADTLKFFLSLYGHKLPVLCLDISSDSTLIVTGSADRNVKLWGLDFGDCHKSIFAHDDSIMCTQFVSKTHMFFTGGKDGKIKEWDGDNFQHIQTLQGHFAEVWTLAVSPTGNFVVSASRDKSLRLWERTQEPLVLQEEQEMEREKEYEESMTQTGDTVVPGETSTEMDMAGKKTVETVKAAERLMEAIELHREETAKLEQQPASSTKKAAVHPLFQAHGVSTPDQYVLDVIKRIKSSELEEALLVLPFSYIPDLLRLLNVFICQRSRPELVCRCLFFLLRVHQGQITSNQLLLPVINSLRNNSLHCISQLRDTLGFNLAALEFMKQQISAKNEVSFFADATGKFKEKKKRQKKKAILSIKT